MANSRRIHTPSSQVSRRAFVLGAGSGLAAVGLGLGRLRAGTTMPFMDPLPNSWRPIRGISAQEIAESIHVKGLPFLPRFIGDHFTAPEGGEIMPFHNDERGWPDGRAPRIDEEIEVAIVGGGLGGLTAAWTLRELRPVVFELRDRFGGNAMGESWRGATTSLGSVYVITPDPGTDLHELYTTLGMDKAYRFEDGAINVEWFGKRSQDLCSLAGCTPKEQKALERYLAQVQYRAGGGYPEIPLTGNPAADAMVRELDTRTLEDDIQNESGPNLPPILQQAIQAYCYSSFGVGWDQISAAGGWNFLAAEEFGRWVLPGGNAYMADALWRRLRAVEQTGGEPGSMLRGNSPAVDVQPLANDRWKVSYRRPDGEFRAVSARKVVMANSKHVAKYLINDIDTLDHEKAEAFNQIRTMAYIVLNVLLKRPAENIPYDLFLLGEGDLPMTPDECSQASRPVDVLDGHYANPPLKFPQSRGGSIQFFWPLPWHTARFTLVNEMAFQDYAERAASELLKTLPRLGISFDDIVQVRMVRWAHAMPIPVPGLIDDGTCEAIRRPIADSLYFANQDNWLLPAVENTVLDAIEYGRAILDG